MDFRGTEQELAARLHGVVVRLQDATDPLYRPVLNRAADALARRIEAEYRIKASGGRDSAGIRWPETVRSRTGGSPIMIDTGKLIESLKFSVNGGEIIIRFDAEHARHALARRPAWPAGGIPDEWFSDFVNEVALGLAEVIERELQ